MVAGVRLLHDRVDLVEVRRGRVRTAQDLQVAVAERLAVVQADVADRLPGPGDVAQRQRQPTRAGGRLHLLAGEVLRLGDPSPTRPPRTTSAGSAGSRPGGPGPPATPHRDSPPPCRTPHWSTRSWCGGRAGAPVRAPPRCRGCW